MVVGGAALEDVRLDKETVLRDILFSRLDTAEDFRPFRVRPSQLDHPRFIRFSFLNKEDGRTFEGLQSRSCNCQRDLLTRKLKRSAYKESGQPVAFRIVERHPSQPCLTSRRCNRRDVRDFSFRLCPI